MLCTGLLLFLQHQREKTSRSLAPQQGTAAPSCVRRWWLPDGGGKGEEKRRGPIHSLFLSFLSSSFLHFTFNSSCLHPQIPHLYFHLPLSWQMKNKEAQSCIFLYTLMCFCRCYISRYTKDDTVTHIRSWLTKELYTLKAHSWLILLSQDPHSSI